MRNLNQALFHGTSNEITGGAVVPARAHGLGSHWGDMGDMHGQRSQDHAFATSDEGQAWHFASHSADETGQRAHVYEVAPHPQMKEGAFHSSLSEYVAPKFPLKQRIDIKPGHQGTVPGVNWNEHQDWANAPYGSRVDSDANHPEPEFHGSVGTRNSDRTTSLERIHKAKFRDQLSQRGDLSKVHADQGTLFDSEPVSPHHEQATRARTHDQRHLLNIGAQFGEWKAEHHEINPERLKQERR